MRISFNRSSARRIVCPTLALLATSLFMVVHPSLSRSDDSMVEWNSWPEDDRSPSFANDFYQAAADPRDGFWLLNSRFESPTLLRYADGKWSPADVVLDGVKSVAVRLFSCANGRVLAVFEPPDAQTPKPDPKAAPATVRRTIAELTATGWKSLCATEDRLPFVVYADSRNRIWCLGGQRDIRWFEDGRWHKLTPDFRSNQTRDRRGTPVTEPPPESYPLLRMMELEDGALWFWSDSQDARGLGPSQLDGMLVFERNQWTQHKDLDENNRIQFGAAAMLSPRLMLIGTTDGLVAVNTSEKSCKHIDVLDGSIGDGFIVPTLSRDRNGNVWIVAQPTATQRSMAEFQRAQQSGWSGELWRFDGEELVQEIAGLDLGRGQSLPWERPITHDAKGNLWVGTAGGGVMVLTSKGHRRLDWRDGLRLTTVDQIVVGADGDVLLCHARSGCVVLQRATLEALLEQPQKPSRWRYEQAGDIISDATGNFWTLRGLPRQLMRFDEGKWSAPIEVPQGVDMTRVTALSIDSRGKFWFFYPERRIVIFDGKEWGAHESLQEAMDRQLPLPKGYSLSVPRSKGSLLMLPDGSFWALEGNDRLHHYDGTRWWLVGANAVDPNSKGFVAPPFVGDDGNIHLRMQSGTWVYADGEWKKGEASRSPDEIRRERFWRKLPPQNQWPVAPVATWPNNSRAEQITSETMPLFVLGQQGLYKFADGQWTTLDPNPNPLSGTPQISDLKVDKTGALWIRVTRGMTEGFAIGGRGQWRGFILGDQGVWAVLSGDEKP